MSATIYRASRAAMRCWCEVFLCGEDRQHLAAVAELALDEITRVERMLSRFDPASEVHRLNHAPVGLPLRVTPELFAILVECRDWWRQTAGAFDITVGSKPGIFFNAGLLPSDPGVARTAENAEARRPKQTPGFGDTGWHNIHIDEANHTLARTIDGITFDFGGYGKGYAIDRALAITQQYGIESACLHAGTSSIVASGPPPDAAGWPIAIRHPEDESYIVAEWSLCHAGMSTSAASQEVINPTENRPLKHAASCTVMATTATFAEVWSTALLVRNENPCDEMEVQRVLIIDP